MRKRAPKKLSLSRETIHRLTDAALGGVVGAFEDVVIGVGKDNLSIDVCTRVISDCLTCTTPQNSCPYTTPSPSCTCA